MQKKYKIICPLICKNITYAGPQQPSLGEQKQIGAGIANWAHMRAAIAQRFHRMRVIEQFRDFVFRLAGRRDINQILAVIFSKEIIFHKIYDTI